ncbi:AAA family ATPase [Arthrobacter sp. GMC3]|uniref:AAA family ATPase n=1 Tax=Arthrobacter sp. GMC3 TaxID=2058894 RepID=UPI000CE35A81|nr:AAA family ATPase [Arthrobacter sp. GMC3]
MAQQLILVNGIPAAGKTTLSKQLGADLGIPVLSKDVLMESFANATAATVPSSRLGALASETMWQLAGMISGSVIVESFWLKRRDLDYARAGLVIAGNPAFVEIWCDVVPELAWDRYQARSRHPIHPADDALGTRWNEWVENAEPLALGSVITVRTDVPVDLEKLNRQISTHLLGEIPASVELLNSTPKSADNLHYVK